MNNATIFAADRATHVKIVVVALFASIAVLLVGITARNTTAADATARIQAAGPAVKAGKPMALSHSNTTAIR
jgi:predicted kinase